MSNRRLVNRCLMGAVLASSTVLLGIYSLGFAQEPPSAAFPSEKTHPHLFQVAQNDGPDLGGGNASAQDHAKWDVPGGMALDPESKKRVTAGLNTCGRCHSKAGPSVKIPGLPDEALDDGWCLLNELFTFASHDKHFGSYAVLLNERSQKMAELLEIVDAEGNSMVHRDQRCLACHTGLPIHEMQPDAQGFVSEDLTKDLKLNRGVTCEGCHGPSKVAGGSGLKDWYSEHDGSNADWRYMSPKEKAETYGYYDVRSPVSRAKMCASCHVGNAPEGRVVTHEMYAAGHPPLPGFEMETFSDQEPQHWRDIRHKPKTIRDQWLKKTGETWRKNNWGEAEAEDTRDMLISACVSLAEYARLNADLANPNFEFPLQSEKWSKETWPEFAQFACYACHHDLQAKGWRINRPTLGVPGRPTPYEWPIALVKIALQSSKSGDSDKVMGLIKQFQHDSVAGPFGDRDKFISSGKALSNELMKLANSLEENGFSREDEIQVLNNITTLAQSQVWDYDSARQLVWAYRISYEELKGTAPNIEKLYDNKLPIEDLLSWYGAGNANLDEVQQSLAGLEKMFLLDLRKGRVKKKVLTDKTNRGSVQTDVKVLEWQADLALPQIGAYDPEAFKQKMAELQGKLQKEIVAK